MQLAQKMVQCAAIFIMPVKHYYIKKLKLSWGLDQGATTTKIMIYRNIHLGSCLNELILQCKFACTI